jgi:hypothetical protein
VAAESDDLGRRVWELLAETREILDRLRESVQRARESARRARQERGLEDAREPEDGNL